MLVWGRHGVAGIMYGTQGVSPKKSGAGNLTGPTP